VDLVFEMADPDETGVSPMYKVIVVGTDGSDRASVAVREAMALAKVSGAELHAVNVVHPAVSVGFSDSRAQQDQVNSMKEQRRSDHNCSPTPKPRGSLSRSTIQVGMQRLRFWAWRSTSLRISSSSAIEV
jgi:hypothetical protein